MYYKINDIARLLNIGSQSIRRYQEQGLIVLKTDETNGYRYFDLGSINILLRIIYYKKFGYTTNEIRNLLDSDSREYLQQSLKEKRTDLQNTIDKLQMELAKIDDTLQSLSESAEFDVCRFEEMDKVYYLQYCKQRQLADYDEYHKLLSQWIEFMPLTNSSPSFELINGSFHHACNYGLIIRDKYLLDHNLVNNENVEMLGPAKAIHCYIKCTINRKLSVKSFDSLFEFAKKEHCTIKRIIGITLATYNQKNDRIRIHEIWAIIDSAC